MGGKGASQAQFGPVNAAVAAMRRTALIVRVLHHEEVTAGGGQDEVEARVAVAGESSAEASSVLLLFQSVSVASSGEPRRAARISANTRWPALPSNANTSTSCAAWMRPRMVAGSVMGCGLANPPLSSFSSANAPGRSTTSFAGADLPSGVSNVKAASSPEVGGHKNIGLRLRVAEPLLLLVLRNLGLALRGNLALHDGFGEVQRLGGVEVQAANFHRVGLACDHAERNGDDDFGGFVLGFLVLGD